MACNRCNHGIKVKRFEVGEGMRIYDYYVSAVINAEHFGPLPEVTT